MTDLLACYTVILLQYIIPSRRKKCQGSNKCYPPQYILPKQSIQQQLVYLSCCPLYLQDKYDIAASAAPRCIAVQHIAAFWKETSRRTPEAANTS